MGEIRYLDKTGDQKVIWNPENDDEVEAAEATFDMLKDKGFTAYRVKKDGTQGKKITKFDPKAGRIIMVPKLAGG